MACACKMKERFPLKPAITRADGKLTLCEIVNMRLQKGAKPIQIGF